MQAALTCSGCCAQGEGLLELTKYNYFYGLASAQKLAAAAQAPAIPSADAGEPVPTQSLGSSEVVAEIQANKQRPIIGVGYFAHMAKMSLHLGLVYSLGN